MRTLSLVLTLLFVAAVADAAAAPPELKTEEQKTLYALGLVLAQNLGAFALNATELEIVKAGLTDGVTNKDKKVDLQTYGPKIQELQKARVTAAAVPERKAGQAYIEKAAAEKGAIKTPSGAVVTTLKPGTGPSPAATDKVKGLRQLDPAGRADHLSAQRRDQVLDRRRAADEGRRQEPPRLSRGHRLWRSRRAAQDQAGRDPRLRGRAPRNREVGISRGCGHHRPRFAAARGRATSESRC